METKPPNIKLAVPFFKVTDMEVSLPFYTEGLGFEVTNHWTPRGKIEWCWLERDGVAIMLQQPRNSAAERAGLLGAGVSIAFQCADALALYREFKEGGLDVAEPFVSNGLWAIGLKDPDGFQLEFASPTDVPEETKYSDWLK